MLKDIIFSMLIGGSVGMIGHIRKHGKLIMPRRTKRFIYLGFLEEMLLGAVASLIIVIYTYPNSLVENIFLSVLAGIGGDAVLTRFKMLGENNSEK